jgi:hypothetical protein
VLALSGNTETMIARNHQAAAEATTAAEAGLSHAVAVTLSNLRSWPGTGFSSASHAMSGLLAGPDQAHGTAAADQDNGSLEDLGIPRPPARLDLAGLSQMAYEARVFDDDDPARGVPLSAADLTRIGEDGHSIVDRNTRIVVQAVGHAATGAVVTVEAIIVPLAMPAVVTGQSLTVSGTAVIGGTQGGVHSNQDLLLHGSPLISKDATASRDFVTSGLPVAGGESGGGFPPRAIPAVRALDHRPDADVILASDGRMTLADGSLVCDASVDDQQCASRGYGWTYRVAEGWALRGDDVTAGTYYVEGNVVIAGNPGSTGEAVALSIIAEGFIAVSGRPRVQPDAPGGVLFLAGTDLKIDGLLRATTREALILVREQCAITGSSTISGQILVEGAADDSPLVTGNLLSGGLTVVYNGSLPARDFAVSGWRRVP